MSILEICEQIQAAGVSRLISESTWGYPIVGALHVLAIALFGGAVLVSHLGSSDLAMSDLAIDVRWIRRLGITLVVLTGTLLFASAAVRYYESSSFRIKLVLLVLIALSSIASPWQHRSRLVSAIALGLWAATIFAARGIAFF